MVVNLSQNKITVVDSGDYPLVAAYKWYAGSSAAGFYALSHDRETHKTVRMHRLILGAQPGQIVDHINGDTLDNRRANLRFVTASQNGMNQKTRKGRKTSVFKGVSGHQRVKRWEAKICVKGKTKHLGYFSTEAPAHAAYCRASAYVHGSYRRLEEL